LVVVAPDDVITRFDGAEYRATNFSWERARRPRR
jgi:hypothetical protein